MQISKSLLNKIIVWTLVVSVTGALIYWYNSQKKPTIQTPLEPTKADLTVASPTAQGPIAEVIRNPKLGTQITITGTVTTFPDANSFALTENNASIVVQKQGADTTLQVGDVITVTGILTQSGDILYIDSESVTIIESTTTTPEDPSPLPTTNQQNKNDDYIAPTPTPAFSLNEQQVRQVAIQHTEGGTVLSTNQENQAGTIWTATVRKPDTTVTVLLIAVQGDVITVNEQ